jgi:DNA-directed RNA polymerase subunit M/transcription elongation factor TFIIS
MSEPMKCNCPKCGSKNTKTFPMIYKNGLSTYRGRSSGSGISLQSGSSRFFFMSSRTVGKRQSALSSAAAPPSNCSNFLLLIALINAIINPWWLGVSGFAIVFYIIAQPSSSDERWEKSWMCLRCGHQYIFNN